MSDKQTRWDTTVYRTDGTSTTHDNLTSDQALKLENQAFTNPQQISSVKSEQRTR